MIQAQDWYARLWARLGLAVHAGVVPIAPVLSVFSWAQSASGECALLAVLPLVAITQENMDNTRAIGTHGKITPHTSLRACSRACRVRICAQHIITPVRNIDQPTMGIRKFDVLDMNLNGR